MMSPEIAIALSMIIPLVGAVIIALCDRWPDLRETATMVTAGVLLLIVLTILPDVLAGGRPELLLFDIFPGIPIHFKVEPLGMLFALIASGLWIVTSIYSIGYMRGNNEHKQTRFYVFFAVALSSTMGVAFSGNLLTLFICYEVLTLSTYPLVTHHGDEASMKAGRSYLGILISTSIGLLLVAIIWTWVVAGTLEFKPGGILGDKMGGAMVGVLLALYMYGIGKAALMPVHRWLPAAMVAPTPVSALLHAVAVVKTGVFCVVKIIVYVFGIEKLQMTPEGDWLIYVAGFTILTASIIALRQDNLKRRLAYSTVSQLSYVILATAILAPISVMAAALHIAVHAFGKITLFFAAGSIYTAAHKTEISQLNGIGRRMPWTMGAFAIGSLSMIGLPPTAGFISKWYMLMGAWEMQHIFAIATILISTLLNAGYFLPIVYVAFFRAETVKPSHDHGEAPLPIVIALSITAGLTLVFFWFPDIAINLSRQLIGVGP